MNTYAKRCAAVTAAAGTRTVIHASNPTAANRDAPSNAFSRVVTLPTLHVRRSAFIASAPLKVESRVVSEVVDHLLSLANETDVIFVLPSRAYTPPAAFRCLEKA